MSAVRTAEKAASSKRGQTQRRDRAGLGHPGPEELRLAKVLARCVDAQRRGTDLETILARYPAEADELRPLLEIAAMLQERRRAAACEEREPARG